MKIINENLETILDYDYFNELYAARRFSEIRRIAEDLPAPDLAGFFPELSDAQSAVLFRLLSKEQASRTFVEMDGEVRRRLVEDLNDKELREVMEELYLDDTVDVLEEMPANVVKRMIRASTPETRDLINQMLKYDKDSAGAIMTTEYVRLRPGITVGEALEHIRHVGVDKETVYTCYVTDDERRLLGVVTAKSLLLHSRDTSIRDIMEDKLIIARTDDGKDEVALMFDKYGLIALPVVDSEGRLVGIVTVDDAMDVMREQTEDDFAKLAGITPQERKYLSLPTLSIFLSRVPWLLLLMISATFSSTILNRFEALLPTVLILFVPMLMDTGGNAGGQASVTVIRSLSLGEISLRDALHVLFKEVRVGIMCGISLGAVAFGKVLLIDRLLMGNPDVTVVVALAVSLALAVTVITSKIIGSFLPLLAKRVGLDPAVMASPFITTIVDVLSLVAYFFIADGLL